MIRNYLIVAVRNLLKTKIYSMINISGLSVGLASFFLIMIYVKDELSFDRHFTHADRIFRVYADIKTSNGAQVTALTPPGWARYFLSEYAEIVNLVRVKPPNQWWKVEYNEKIFYEPGWSFIDSTAFELFDLKMISGNRNGVLSNPYQVILSEQAAEKYFSKDDPVGKTFKLDNAYDFTVVGVYKKLPANTHFDFDFLASFVTLRDSIYGANLLELDFAPAAYTYIQLENGADPKLLESKLTDVVYEHVATREELEGTGYEVNLHLQPITDIHLYSHLENEIQPNANVATVYIFTAIAFFILIIAGINFMNLATARSLKRAREVGLRKVVGANKRQLVTQFLGEAVIISMIALVVAIILVALILPGFSTLVGKPINYLAFLDPVLMLSIISFTILSGIFSGLYPAFFISSFKPNDALKANMAVVKSKGILLRKLMITFQFAISIMLVICTGILYHQMKFIRNFDLGLDRDRVLVVQLTDPILRARYRGFKNLVQQIPTVNSVSASFSAPADVVNQAAFRPIHAPPDENWMSYFFGIDYEFFQTLGIELVAGRDLTHGNAADTLGAVIINETAVKSFGWQSAEDAVGQQIEFANNNNNAPHLDIIGVVKDFHMKSVHETISPMVMMYWNQQGYFYTYINIRDDINGTLSQVEQVWKDVMPNYPFQYSFLDDNFDKLYKSEQNLGRLLTYFAGLAIFIACMGLYGLTAFMVENRTKEIGVRKVLGATENQLVIMLSNEYTLLIIAAFVVASPIAYVLMDNWLQSFIYHVNINLIIFVVALFIALVISLITVSYQSFRAASINPVHSLRSE